MTNPFNIPFAKEEPNARLGLSAIFTSAGMKYLSAAAAGALSRSCDPSSLRKLQDGANSKKDDSNSSREQPPMSVASAQNDTVEHQQASPLEHLDDAAPPPLVSSKQAKAETSSRSCPADTEPAKEVASTRTPPAKEIACRNNDKAQRRSAKLGRVLRNLETALVGAEDLSQQLFTNDSSFTTRRKLRLRSPEKVRSPENVSVISRDTKVQPSAKKLNDTHKRTPMQVVSHKKPGSKTSPVVKPTQRQVTRSKIQSCWPRPNTPTSSLHHIPTKLTPSRHAKSVAIASIRDAAIGRTNSHSPEKKMSHVSTESASASTHGDALGGSPVGRATTAPDALSTPLKGEQNVSRKRKEEQVGNSSKKQKLSNHRQGKFTTYKQESTVSEVEEHKPEAPTQSIPESPSLASPMLPAVSSDDSTEQLTMRASEASKTNPGAKSSLASASHPLSSFRPIQDDIESSSTKTESNVFPTANASAADAAGRTVSVTPDPSTCSTTSVTPSSAHPSENRYSLPFPVESIDHDEMQTYFSNILEFGDSGEQVELPPLSPVAASTIDESLFKPLLVFSSHSIIDQPLAMILLDESLLEK